MRRRVAGLDLAHQVDHRDAQHDAVGEEALPRELKGELGTLTALHGLVEARLEHQAGVRVMGFEELQHLGGTRGVSHLDPFHLPDRSGDRGAAEVAERQPWFRIEQGQEDDLHQEGDQHRHQERPHEERRARPQAQIPEDQGPDSREAHSATALRRSTMTASTSSAATQTTWIPIG